MKKALFSLLFALLCLTVPGFAQTNYDTEMNAFDAQNKAQAPPANGILFVGSSSIRMWDGIQDAFPGKPVIQRGFGGSSLNDLIRYTPRVILPYNPKQIVVYAGDNDINANVPAKTLYGQFVTFFTLMRKQLPGATITYISVKPSPARRKYMPVQVEANRLIQQYIGNQRNASFADVYTPMLGANGQPKPELFKADSLHMTDQGYAIWKTVLTPLLK